MRIYALYRRAVRVLVFLVIVSAALFAIGCVSVLFKFCHFILHI
jgi:hypothetical protein